MPDEPEVLGLLALTLLLHSRRAARTTAKSELIALPEQDRSLWDQDLIQILALYNQLLRFTPTAVVARNRAVAVAELHGPGRRSI